MEPNDELVVVGGGVYSIAWEMTEEEAEQVETALCESDDKAGMTPEEVARVFGKQTDALAEAGRISAMAGCRVTSDGLDGVVLKTPPAASVVSPCQPAAPSLPSAQASMLGRLGRD